MKKITAILTAIIAGLFVCSSASAASVTASASQVYAGESFTITINVGSVATWNVHLTASGPVSGCFINQVDSTADALNTPKSFSTTCTATGVGTITATASGDVTAEDGTNSAVSGSVVVYAIAQPASDPEPEPEPEPTPTPSYSHSSTSETVAETKTEAAEAAEEEKDEEQDQEKTEETSDLEALQSSAVEPQGETEEFSCRENIFTSCGENGAEMRYYRVSWIGLFLPYIVVIILLIVLVVLIIKKYFNFPHLSKKSISDKIEINKSSNNKAKKE